MVLLLGLGVVDSMLDVDEVELVRSAFVFSLLGDVLERKKDSIQWRGMPSYWTPFSSRVHLHFVLPVLMWKVTPLASRVV